MEFSKKIISLAKGFPEGCVISFAVEKRKIKLLAVLDKEITKYDEGETSPEMPQKSIISQNLGKDTLNYLG